MIVSSLRNPANNSETVFPCPGKINSGAISLNGWSTNRRTSARGCGKINSGVIRVSAPKAIKSKSSGRGSFKTFLGRRPNSFSSVQVFPAAIPAFRPHAARADNGIHKIRRPRRTIHRRRLPQRGFQNWLVGEILQPRHRVPDDLPRITEVGAKRNNCKCGVRSAECGVQSQVAGVFHSALRIPNSEFISVPARPAWCRGRVFV